ncbi:MAG: hypothetical protein WCW93_00440 [Candidatus Paceibacterota bacterium]
MDEFKKQQLNLKNTEEIQTELNLRPDDEVKEYLRKELRKARDNGISHNDFVDGLNPQYSKFLAEIDAEDREGDQPYPPKRKN